MKTLILHPAYFGSIEQFVYFAKAEKICFENEDNYQKQTYRNRQYIYGANGKLLLNIPIKHLHIKNKRQKYKEVKIENDFKWQINHWRSLEAAYRTSPFFEFYEDEFRPLYEKDYTYLMEFNYACLDVLQSCLQLDIPIEKTEEFIKAYNDSEIVDGRNLISAKKKLSVNLEDYIQVFSNKEGYIPNLSILDLLFNEGPSSIMYLENQVFN
ncbi:WbqC family protein [Mesonia ostreae]|uniref:WbqC family protein n=1 Tax=Mesonia ostreae TaxID=861110 RepID=A0ABU2KLN7_9FLAO|nr:WbqC family protein [Mesonia ostreae]MDT0295618.1 WbqC family protein [Mesonia ostreae]